MLARIKALLTRTPKDTRIPVMDVGQMDVVVKFETPDNKLRVVFTFTGCWYQYEQRCWNIKTDARGYAKKFVNGDHPIRLRTATKGGVPVAPEYRDMAIPRHQVYTYRIGDRLTCYARDFDNDTGQILNAADFVDGVPDPKIYRLIED